MQSRTLARVDSRFYGLARLNERNRSQRAHSSLCVQSPVSGVEEHFHRVAKKIRSRLHDICTYVYAVVRAASTRPLIHTHRKMEKDMYRSMCVYIYVYIMYLKIHVYASICMHHMYIHLDTYTCMRLVHMDTQHVCIIYM